MTSSPSDRPRLDASTRIHLLRALRIVVSLHLLLLLVQPLSAGLFLSGHPDAALAHQTGSRLILVVALTQIALAILFWRRGGGPGWFAAAGAALLAGELLQVAAGHSQTFWFHVPMGVALFGGLTRQQIWVMAQPLVPAARRSPGGSPIDA